MRATGKIWQCIITSFFVNIISNNCQDCTHFVTKSDVSIVDVLTETALKEARKVFPNFDESTVPNFDFLTKEFNSASTNEDIHLNITQLLNKYGHPTETHQVNTSDGYILEIFRIPGNGTTVLVVPGLLSSAEVYVTTGSDRGLAYILANHGFDVWLANTRGSQHGRKHVTLSPDCAEFWDFSWDEVGRYDLPATIDYILEATGQDKLAYTGHSQASTSFFVMASEFPEYNDKISVMVALSTTSFLKHCPSPILDILAPIADPLYSLLQAAGIYDIAPRNPITDLITSATCGTPFTSTLICRNIFFLVFGFDYAQLNATVLPVYFGHFPAGASSKQIIHYLQLIDSGNFGNFDYGPSGNLKRYGSISPPDYALNRITSKIVAFYADRDVLATKPDRERLFEQLPNLVETYRVPNDGFQQGDYLTANDLKTLVNDRVVEFIDKYA